MTAAPEPATPAWLQPLENWSAMRRLSLAFLMCVLPRAAGALALGPAGDYRVFADPAAMAESQWYPLYSWLAAAMWTASGGMIPVHVAWHIVLHAAIGPLTYVIARRLRLGALAAWLAVLGVAWLPYYVTVSARQPQVGVVISFVALLVLTFLTWKDRAWGWGGGLVFAALSAGSLFLRPNLLVTGMTLYGLAILLALRAADRRALVRILASGALVAGVLLAASVVARTRSGHWSPFEPLVGYNLYLGHNRHTGEYLRRWDVISVEAIVHDHGLPAEATRVPDPYQRDAVLWRLGQNYAAAHPSQTFENTLFKAWRWWDVRLEDADKNPLLWNLAYTGPYVACLGLALFGALRLLVEGRGASVGWIAAVLGSYWLPHLVLFPTIRMRMTTEFLLVTLAAFGASALLHRPRARTTSSA